MQPLYLTLHFIKKSQLRTLSEREGGPISTQWRMCLDRLVRVPPMWSKFVLLTLDARLAMKKNGITLLIR